MAQMGTEAERRSFFEQARAQAEDDVKRNAKDTSALTRWGGALLELANFMPGDDAARYVTEAVDKLQKALEIDPKKHDALWCLGNAYTSQGFLSNPRKKAFDLFTTAERCFLDALEGDPGNPIYQRSLDMSKKAPQLYDEIQRHVSSGSSSRQGGQYQFWFDMLGYVTVIGAVMVISALAGSAAAARQSASN